MSSDTTSSLSHSTAQATARTIAGWISSGRYSGGQRLPSQRALTQQLGISRTSLREALSVLQGQGLLAAHPGKGVYVIDAALSENTAEVIENNADSFSTGPKQWRFAHTLTDIYQLRFALESFVCRLAALAAQPDDISLLHTNVEHMRQCLQEGDFSRANRLDFDFHMHIMAMSGNRAVADIFLGISDVILESQLLPFYQRGGWQATVAEHTAIINALEQGNSEAAGHAAAHHVRNAAQRAGVHFPVGS